MQTISLQEMESVRLMNRIDTKYVTSFERLHDLLQRADADYYIQEINGLQVAHYATLYYDTPSCEMYIRHHDRQLRRQKVRVRTYLDTGDSFLEIKNKKNTGRTKKKRIAVQGDWTEDEKAGEFMRQYCWYDSVSLSPSLWTRFERITLVNRARTERLTIDTHLHWLNSRTHREAEIPDLMIIELKRDGNSYSPMAHILQDLRIRPMKMSKYCIGIALTNPDIKQNRFKAKIRRINTKLL